MWPLHFVVSDIRCKIKFEHRIIQLLCGVHLPRRHAELPAAADAGAGPVPHHRRARGHGGPRRRQRGQGQVQLRSESAEPRAAPRPPGALPGRHAAPGHLLGGRPRCQTEVRSREPRLENAD